MKTCIFISLLLLPILFQEARGARLVPTRTTKAFEFMGNSKSDNFEDEDSSNVGKRIVRILESGMIRKLLVTKTSTSGSITPLLKNDDENGKGGAAAEGEGGGQSNNGRIAADDDKKENLSLNSSKKQQPSDLQILDDDVTEMDYSPAQRKPPIHN